VGAVTVCGKVMLCAVVAIGTKPTNRPCRNLLPTGPTTDACLRQLLVAHPDFANDIEIRLVGLEHEKFPHVDCWLKKNVRDVEVMGNHHQI
jgi:hypothetical protein